MYKNILQDFKGQVIETNIDNHENREAIEKWKLMQQFTTRYERLLEMEKFLLHGDDSCPLKNSQMRLVLPTGLSCSDSYINLC